jgi:hypothetical protein
MAANLSKRQRFALLGVLLLVPGFAWIAATFLDPVLSDFGHIAVLIPGLLVAAGFAVGAFLLVIAAEAPSGRDPLHPDREE